MFGLSLHHTHTITHKCIHISKYIIIYTYISIYIHIHKLYVCIYVNILYHITVYIYIIFFCTYKHGNHTSSSDTTLFLHIFAITKAQTSVKNPIQVPLRSHPHPNHQILSRIPKHSTFDDTSAITQLCVAVLSKMLRGKAFKQHTVTTSPSNSQHLGRTVITSTLKKSNPPKKSGPILAEVKMEKTGPFQKATEIPTGR